MGTMECEKERIARISKAILAGISDVDAGSNAVPEPISDATIHSFLKGRRGLALAFWAMNADDQGNPFYVTEAEWRFDEPQPSVVDGPFLDCHTHYLHTGGRHSALQYRAGARCCWWFFPETYAFPHGKITARPKLLEESGSPLQLHGLAQYKEHLLGLYQRSGKRLRFFITPAPRATNLLSGTQDDTASYEDMRAASISINGLVPVEEGPICWPTGVIAASDASFKPRDPRLNTARLWKVYPRSHWSVDSDKEWLKTCLSSALRRLEQLETRDTVLIHWWDDDGAPGSDDLGRVVGEHPSLRFVVFHASYPHQRELAKLLRTHRNLFAEVGGVFANQVLGSHGGDALGDGPPGTLAGPAAAISMIRTLRGRLLDRSGVHENDHKILWGTDAIWHGSPIWQLEAFGRLNLTSNKQQDAEFKRKVLQLNPRDAFQCFGGLSVS